MDEHNLYDNNRIKQRISSIDQRIFAIGQRIEELEKEMEQLRQEFKEKRKECTFYGKKVSLAGGGCNFTFGCGHESSELGWCSLDVCPIY